ncbi:hypothetical protein [Lysinibacillus pakistanensis]|nr:hypothetical protein [Lysinibacillus pakistanensis]WHY48940.1 hypothetical protein QNH22_12175 [Lysinibacillus pakistanensis]
MMQVLFMSLMFVSSFLLQQPRHSVENTATTLCTPIVATSYKYPNNQYQSLQNEDDFYQQINSALYEEYSDASLNIRQKIAFKDIPKAIETFHLKTNLIGKKIDLTQHTFIHPNRQVYFLASFRQTEQETYHKYFIIDAETQTILLGNSLYNPHNRIVP